MPELDSHTVPALEDEAIRPEALTQALQRLIKELAILASASTVPSWEKRNNHELCPNKSVTEAMFWFDYAMESLRARLPGHNKSPWLLIRRYLYKWLSVKKAVLEHAKNTLEVPACDIAAEIVSSKSVSSLAIFTSKERVEEENPVTDCEAAQI